jgi:hypothetical protein
VTETTTLQRTLHDAAAPLPPPPYGLEQAVARGRRLRRRAVAIRAGAVPLALALVVAIAATTMDGGGQAVRTIAPPDQQTGPDAPNPATAKGAATGQDPTTTVLSRAGTVPRVTTTVPLPVDPQHSSQNPPPPLPGMRAPAAGPRMVFVSDNRVYAMKPDGTDKQVVLSSLPGPMAWSADRRLFLVNYAGDGASDLYTLDLQTGARRLIAHDPMGYNITADFSPDGRHIVYSVHDYQDVHMLNDDPYHLYIADVDGSNARPVAEGISPSWSPDGTRIAYFDNDRRLMVMNADGAGARTLPQAADWTQPPAWSPDSAWLAAVDPSPMLLKVIRVDSAESRTVGEGHAQPGLVTWTDNDHIAYARTSAPRDNTTGGCANPPCEDGLRTGIWSAARDGSSDSALTTVFGDRSPVMPKRQG